MNACRYIKIAPLVLLISACTSGSGPTSTAAEPSDDGVSSASSTTGTSGGLSTAEVSGDLTTDAISSLSTSVGNVTGSDNQAGADQPNVAVPNEVTPGVDGPVVDVPPEDDGTNTQSDVNTVGTTDNNPIVRIPKTDFANAPKIDGDTLDYLAGTQLLSGEWRFAAQFNGANQPLGISQYMFGEPGTNNSRAGHHWAAVHDGIYLYVLVVSDDAGVHFQDTNELRKPWKDDSIELFIDGNNSRLTEYDGVDDFHMTINLLSSADVSNSSYIADPKIRQSDTSATLPADLIFAAGPGKGPVAADVTRGRKDIYEIRIKLSELNIDVNAPFGIELQINDDDNGGSRDAKWGWNHPTGNSVDNDFTWQNPSFMGTAILLQ